MKLQHSDIYTPLPIIMTTDQRLFHIPLHLCLYHTVEEIQEKIAIFQDVAQYNTILHYQQTLSDLFNVALAVDVGMLFVPYETSREKLGQDHDFVFLGLHGGDGENGTIQKKLDSLGIRYNGPGAEASALCANKLHTKQAIDAAAIPDVRTARSTVIDLATADEILWEDIQQTITGTQWICKPIDDGCSAGVVAFSSLQEFQTVV